MSRHEQWEIDACFASRSGLVGAGADPPNSPNDQVGSSTSSSSTGASRNPAWTSSWGKGRGKGKGSRGGRGARGGNPAASATSPSNEKGSRTSSYYPRFKTGSFALLIQLRLSEVETGSAWLSGRTLKSAAQRFCTMPMDSSGAFRKASDHYGAWSAMNKTLVEKELVLRIVDGGRGASFRLTDTGRALAIRIIEDHGIDENGEWEGLPREERSSSSAASRTTGAVLRGAGPTSTKPGTSPVNPYSAAARGGGKGSPAALRAQAAEARIEKLKAGNEKRESASVSASVATTAKTGKVATGGAFAGGGAVDGDRAVAGGSKRGRQLQERGEEKYVRRKKLYDIVSPAGASKAERHASDANPGGQLLAALSQFTRDKIVKKVGGVDQATPPADAGEGSPFDQIDDDWLSLKPRAREGAASASLSPIARPATASTLASGARGAAEQGRGGSGTGRAVVGRGAVSDVVDMTLSDDDEDEPVVMPPSSRLQSRSRKPRGEGRRGGRGRDEPALSPSGGGSGVDGGRGWLDATTVGESEGSGGGGASSNGGGRTGNPTLQATHFRSLTRAGGEAPNGALTWKDRPCPAWLQEELTAGIVKASDRMIDAFDLVLIVDSNEPSDLREAVETLAKSTRFKLLRRVGLCAGCDGLDVQRASLPVGDFAWAWRRRRGGCREKSLAETAQEVLLIDCLVERKKDDDAVDSVEGPKGRYKKQKRRLHLSGMTRLVYLLEGNLKTFQAHSTGMDKSRTIRTMEASSQVQGFVVKRTKDHSGTAAFLLSLSSQLMTSQGFETVGEFCSNRSRPKVTLSEFRDALDVSALETRTVLLTFAKLLLQMNRLGPEGALVIARKFHTPRSFLQALDRCSTRDERCCLVKNLKLSEGGKRNSTRRIGDSVASRLISLFCGSC